MDYVSTVAACDKFKHPISGWLLADRSIVYDAWISWRQALPPDPSHRALLDCQTSNAIMTLAWGIHEVHQRFADYQRIGDTPFHISRWWDPDAEWDWATGQRCLFRIEGSDSEAFIRLHRPETSPITVTAASASFLEAKLKRFPDPRGLAADHVFSTPRQKPLRRKPQSPRSGTPDQKQPAPESEQISPQPLA